MKKLIALLTLLLAAGCGGSSSSSGGSAPAAQSGSLALSVTDSPYPFALIQQAVIVVTKVEIHRTDGSKATPDEGDAQRPGDQGAQGNQGDQGNQGHEGDQGDQGGDSNGHGRDDHGPGGQGHGEAAVTASAVTADGFTVIDTKTRAYDLIQLQQGTKALLTRFAIRAGTYDQLRLTVASGSVTLTDGRTFPLTVASGDESGLTILLRPPLTVTSFLSQELVLDFDLARSFEAIPEGCKHAEEVKDFKLHPVIRAQVAQDSCTIAGTVTHAGAPVGGAKVTVTDGTFTQTGTTRADGVYIIGFLPAGTYVVSVEADSGTAQQAGVVVTFGNEVTVNLSF